MPSSPSLSPSAETSSSSSLTEAFLTPAERIEAKSYEEQKEAPSHEERKETQSHADNPTQETKNPPALQEPAFTEECWYFFTACREMVSDRTLLCIVGFVSALMPAFYTAIYISDKTSMVVLKNPSAWWNEMDASDRIMSVINSICSLAINAIFNPLYLTLAIEKWQQLRAQLHLYNVFDVITLGAAGIIASAAATGAAVLTYEAFEELGWIPAIFITTIVASASFATRFIGAVRILERFEHVMRTILFKWKELPATEEFQAIPDPLARKRLVEMLEGCDSVIQKELDAALSKRLKNLDTKAIEKKELANFTKEAVTAGQKEVRNLPAFKKQMTERLAAHGKRAVFARLAIENELFDLAIFQDQVRSEGEKAVRASVRFRKKIIAAAFKQATEIVLEKDAITIVNNFQKHYVSRPISQPNRYLQAANVVNHLLGFWFAAMIYPTFAQKGLTAGKDIGITDDGCLMLSSILCGLATALFYFETILGLTQTFRNTFRYWLQSKVRIVPIVLMGAALYCAKDSLTQPAEKNLTAVDWLFDSLLAPGSVSARIYTRNQAPAVTTVNTLPIFNRLFEPPKDFIQGIRANLSLQKEKMAPLFGLFKEKELKGLKKSRSNHDSIEMNNSLHINPFDKVVHIGNGDKFSPGLSQRKPASTT